MEKHFTTEMQLMDWLLEPENPNVRYFTLKKINRTSVNDTDMKKIQEEIINSSPVKEILALQRPSGYWDNDESATTPMYVSTAYQLILLAELGANWIQPEIKRAVGIVFDQAQDECGAFPYESDRYEKHKPFDFICLDAMVSYGLIGLEVPYSDRRMRKAVDHIATALGSGDYRCRFNKGAECTWGVVKALRVLSCIPKEKRSDEVEKAIENTVDYLLSHNIAAAEFPHKEGGTTSKHWFNLGWPRSYQADILQTALVLSDLGYGQAPRLKPVADFLLSKRLDNGAWPLEDTWNKMSVPFVRKSKRAASKWISWQVFYVLKSIGIIL